MILPEEGASLKRPRDTEAQETAASLLGKLRRLDPQITAEHYMVDVTSSESTHFILILCIVLILTVHYLKLFVL